MSDNELYQLAGWELMSTSDIFSINPEVPPLGKFMYGWSIVLTGNPFWASISLYTLILILFFSIALLILKNKEKAIWSTLFLSSAPLYFAQISQTMLDLPQLFFFLLHLLFIVLANSDDKIKALQKRAVLHNVNISTTHIELALLFIAGLSLGLFAAVKIGVYVPIILLATLILLWKKKKLPYFIVVSLGCGIGYVLPFIPYILDHSVIAWLKNEKWMLNFYLSANSSRSWITPFIVFTTSLTGWYQGWWNQGWQFVNEWTVVWPIVVGSLIWKIKSHWQTKKITLIFYLQILGCTLLVANMFLPFWPRYFLLLLPLGCILIVHFLLKNKLVIYGLFIVLFIQACLFWRPQPQSKLSFAINDLTTGNYHELYHHLDTSSQSQIDQVTFYTLLRSFEHQLQVSSSSAVATYPLVLPWQSTTEIPVEIERFTPLGSIKTNTVVSAERHQNVWKIQWNNKLLAEDWEPGSVIETTLSLEYPPLVTADDVVLMEYRKSKYIYLYRPNLQYSSQLIDELSYITRRPTVDLERTIQVDYQYFDIIPIGFIKDDATLVEIEHAQSLPGISMEEKPRLVVADLTDPEKVFLTSYLNEKAIYYDQQAGTSILISPNGTRKTIIEKPLIDSQLLKLDKSFLELFGREFKNK